MVAMVADASFAWICHRRDILILRYLGLHSPLLYFIYAVKVVHFAWVVCSSGAFGVKKRLFGAIWRLRLADASVPWGMRSFDTREEPLIAVLFDFAKATTP